MVVTHVLIQNSEMLTDYFSCQPESDSSHFQKNLVYLRVNSSRKSATHVKISDFNQCQKNDWEKIKFNNKDKHYFIAFIKTSEHFNSAEQ